jgi:predicted permease
MKFWRRREESLDREIEDYIDRQTEENIAAGMDPDEARHAARRKLGPVVRVKEDTRAAWGWIWVERLWQDLRHGWRMLAKNPGFTLVAVLSLALGVGANCAMFSFADMMLLRPLPVLRPSEIVTVGSTNRTISANQYDFLRASYRDYVDIRDRSKSFDGLTASNLVRVRFATTPEASPEVKMGGLATGNFFPVLGVDMELGRGFRLDEDQVPGRDHVVVLSHDLWELEFAADRSILGRAVRINGIDFTVIGVAPAEFTGLDQWVRPAFYMPMMMWPQMQDGPNPLELRDVRFLVVKGRLKPGTSVAHAQAEVVTIAAALEKEYPKANRNQKMAVRTELEARIKSVPMVLSSVVMLMSLAGAVLLAACANVAVLLTSRAPVRAREIALRLAIGAGRFRLIRQLTTESLLVALAGGLAGLAVGYAGVRLFRGITYPSDVPVVISFQMDHRAFVFSMAVALCSVLLFGLVPAFQTTRADLVTALKDSGAAAPGRRRQWGRNLLVVSQVAVSLVLITISVFMYANFRRNLPIGPGFRTDHLLIMGFDPSLLHYNAEQTRQFFKQLVERSRAVPGVKSVALASFLPLTVEAEGLDVLPEGFQPPAGRNSLQVMSSRVDENFFDTMRLPIVQGRGFRETDGAAAPRVAVVNQHFARHHWPGQNPIGKRFRLHDGNGPWVEIVGEAKVSKYINLQETPTEFVYLPYAQNPQPRMTLLVESTVEAGQLAAPLREVVRRLDVDMPTFNTRTMEDFYQVRGVQTPLVVIEIVGAMGAMGMVLSLVGLYGLVSYAVSRRTREIGIRMAIGAGRDSVLRMVLRQGLVLTASGIGIGLILSIAARRLVDAAFSDGSNTASNVVLFPLVAVALLAVTMLAAYIPARRASQVDPIKALRFE